jgi:hypothetical protein
MLPSTARELFTELRVAELGAGGGGSITRRLEREEDELGPHGFDLLGQFGARAMRGTMSMAMTVVPCALVSSRRSEF